MARKKTIKPQPVSVTCGLCNHISPPETTQCLTCGYAVDAYVSPLQFAGRFVGYYLLFVVVGVGTIAVAGSRPAPPSETPAQNQELMSHEVAPKAAETRPARAHKQAHAADHRKASHKEAKAARAAAAQEPTSAAEPPQTSAGDDAARLEEVPHG